jgi:hypothetical protein
MPNTGKDVDDNKNDDDSGSGVDFCLLVITQL